ncbi:hypothetical protein BDY24DRAFT_400595 [Mrakia frigida]|uniref:polysaccharide deacetylase family protein n=1 Tax=Mrakia frigida TaxID=29902 RepID=UPI003FCC07DB
MRPSLLALASIFALLNPQPSSAHGHGNGRGLELEGCLGRRDLTSFARRGDDGSATAGSTPANAISTYKCDPNTCKLPNCACASTDAPGGLKPEETPMFIVLTADDAIQTYTTAAIDSLVKRRSNPNGCDIKMTYFTSLAYTNYSLVTEWFVKGNEIADHSMTHPELPGADEIKGNLIALNALAGIPLSSISGFRFPYLNYSAEGLTTLHELGFTYDSSATASSPVNAPTTDAFWPYTLDYGLVNDCSTFEGICYGEPALPGFWEIPMYAIFDNRTENNIHLMDPWLDEIDNPAFTLQFMKDTFTAHYNGKRQPFGLYTHPIHVATGYPGVKDPIAIINMINQFLDWAQAQPNVWIVSNEQLLAWVRDPVPTSQLNSSPALRCSTPDLPEEAKICNGMDGHEDGLLERCPFEDFPFFTCYGCPVFPPTVEDPNPAQDTSSQTRYRLPANCSTAFWDPIGNTCLCQSGDCSFSDVSRPIGANGANLTGGGTNVDGDTSTASAVSTAHSYTPFNHAGRSTTVSRPLLLSLLVVCIAMTLSGSAFVLSSLSFPSFLCSWTSLHQFF